MNDNPPESYVNATYYSIHTFEFIDSSGLSRPVIRCFFFDRPPMRFLLQKDCRANSS
jgi:hypothetical protein